jgi:hypothetical protein
MGFKSGESQFAQKSPPTDQQRTSFINGLEKRYRADSAFYAGAGQTQYDGRTVEGLALPRSVLEKFYYQNARRTILGLARSRFG